MRNIAPFATLIVLFWMLFSTWPVTLASDRVPLPVVGSQTPAGTAAVVVRTYDAATAAALEQYIETNHLDVALFVTSGSAKGLSPTTTVTIGITEEPRTSRMPHPVRAWEEPRDTSASIRELTGSNPVYFLPRKGNPDTIDFALKPRNTVIIWPNNVNSESVGPGVLLVETEGKTPNQAIAALNEELNELAAKGLTLVGLNAAT